MTPIAHVNACGISMDDLQSRIGSLQPLLQLLALLAVQPAAPPQTLKSGHLPLSHGILSWLEFARLGSVGVHYTNSPTGSSLALSGFHSPPNHESRQLKSCSATGTKAPRR
jgi:hypothetical protein